MPGALGHLTPPDRDHISAWPLAVAELAGPEPVCLAGPWFTDFDRPRQLTDGSWHLPAARHIRGTVRGDHCTVLAQMGAVHALHPAWWAFYNQGPEGACDGFAHAQRESLRRGRGTYDGFWLYDQARKREGTFPSGEGTTSRTVCDVLRLNGLRTQSGLEASRDPALDGPVDPALGISAVRWATNVEDIMTALGRPDAFALPLLNSWGDAYPRIVWVPPDTVQLILDEQGEADIVTDR